MKTAIKVTLNSSVVFDAKILDYLEGKKNKAGLLKQLAYDRLVSLSYGDGYPERTGVDLSQATKGPNNSETQIKDQAGIDERSLDEKLDKFADFKF